LQFQFTDIGFVLIQSFEAYFEIEEHNIDIVGKTFNPLFDLLNSLARS
jgi:hypothetical protein